MPNQEVPAVKRLRKVIVERLEDLQRAGVSHLRTPRFTTGTPATGGPATAKSEPTAARRGPPPAKGAPAAAKPPSPPAFPQQQLLSLGSSGGTSSGQTGTVEDRAAALAEVARRVAVCVRCTELAETRTQTVFGSGNPHARLVFLGEAPGADEDRQGLPFVGRAGQLLTDMIVKGMRLRREDVYILNILKCRPPNNRTPLPREAANCREYLDRQLEIIRPEFICCLGAVAAQNLLGISTPIGQLRGRILNYEGIKVVCTYHPAYLLRNPAAKRPTWDDLRLLMSAMGLPTPKK